MEMNLILQERFLLAYERIVQIETEETDAVYTDYFKKTARWIRELCGIYQRRETQEAELSLESLQTENRSIYEDVLPGNYEHSYANPEYAVKVLGEEYGRLLSVLYAEIRTLIPFVYENNLENIVIRMELFLEVYNAFLYADAEAGSLPAYKEVKEILYWFALDYAEEGWKQKLYEQINPEYDYFTNIIKNSDLSDLRYLYRFGEYITESELETARYLNSLPEDTIQLMADTYTEGYRIGFSVTGKDISKKKCAGIVYRIGFERVVRQAILNFEKLGIQTAIRRNLSSLICAGAGVSGHDANKQYDFDHKDDAALFLDKFYMNRKLEAAKAAFEANKEAAALYGGPAVMEVFGEEPFAPRTKRQACKLSEEQQKLMVDYKSYLFQIQNEYIKEEERSFTIIAFPIPDIGEAFPAIFDEVIRINTLDYSLYQSMQQKLIQALDKADYVSVKGMNGNRTDLKVWLHPVANSEKETKFENCVADVNIPVGEVFTSPQLTGTNGILHVTRVFLHGLEYRDLQIDFQDGMVAAYTCGNFETEQENQDYIKENLLYHHETLPMGEFAIGTNTTAYVAAQKFDMAAKLPILIAEKMGPHFALGDTCYSHAEDIPMYNPDGKEMIARENEISALRNQDMKKAYFNCHTDITIPYDELAELSAWKEDGTKEVLIENGRFVLPGLEALNEPFSK